MRTRKPRPAQVDQAERLILNSIRFCGGEALVSTRDAAQMAAVERMQRAGRVTVLHDTASGYGYRRVLPVVGS